jgi:hypothetical protein
MLLLPQKAGRWDSFLVDGNSSNSVAIVCHMQCF